MKPVLKCASFVALATVFFGGFSIGGNAASLVFDLSARLDGAPRILIPSGYGGGQKQGGWE